MTTIVQNVARYSLSEAASAVRLLHERFSSIVSGSADAAASGDAWALIGALTTAASDFTTNASSWQVDVGNTYPLTWSTSGSNDAVTKAQLLSWLSGSPKPPWFGANHHSGSNGDMLPRLGDGLLALFEQL